MAERCQYLTKSGKGPQCTKRKKEGELYCGQHLNLIKVQPSPQPQLISTKKEPIISQPVGGSHVTKIMSCTHVIINVGNGGTSCLNQELGFIESDEDITNDMEHSMISLFTYNDPDILYVPTDDEIQDERLPNHQWRKKQAGLLIATLDAHGLASEYRKGSMAFDVQPLLQASLDDLMSLNRQITEHFKCQFNRQPLSQMIYIEEDSYKILYLDYT